MRIDGSALGQRTNASAAGRPGGAGNSYDAQIKQLKEKREEYVEKMREAKDAEQEKMLQLNITAIDARIMPLEKAKADDAQRKVEKQQAKTEPAGEAEQNGATGAVSKTKESEEPGSASAAKKDNDGDDPFALREGEELFWIDGEDGSWPAKRRKPEYPSELVDMSV